MATGHIWQHRMTNWIPATREIAVPQTCSGASNDSFRIVFKREKCYLCGRSMCDVNYIFDSVNFQNANFPVPRDDSDRMIVSTRTRSISSDATCHSMFTRANDMKSLSFYGPTRRIQSIHRSLSALVNIGNGRRERILAARERYPMLTEVFCGLQVSLLGSYASFVAHRSVLHRP